MAWADHDESQPTAALLRRHVGVAGEAIVIQGIAAPNDGLGGVFYWLTGSQTDDNLNTIVPQAASTGGWIRAVFPSVTGSSASTTTPLIDGTAAIGTGTTWARADHVHPTDTSRSAAFVAVAGYGTPTGGTRTASFAGASATLPQTSAMLAQLIVDLKAQGLLAT